jgi:hypothetical protein
VFEDNPNPFSAHFVTEVQNVLHGTVTYKIMDKVLLSMYKKEICTFLSFISFE